MTTDFKEYSAQTGSGRQVSLRFPADEHHSRLATTRAALRQRGYDALIVFAQESHYYLTGYDTAGYVFFQAGIITADERPTILLTRRPDQRQAETASLYEEVRIWKNTEGADPSKDLRDILAELGLEGGKIAIEFATYGLTAANGRLVEASLNGFCNFDDGSDIVRTQRLVKSEAELDYVRQAGKLADAAVEAAVGVTRPGINEGELNGAALAAMMSGGGEVPPGGPLVNSGERALFGRAISGPREIRPDDQVIVELSASFCRYNVCIESTISVGPTNPVQVDMMKVANEALYKVKEAARPGAELGTLDDIHRQVLDKAGFESVRFAACGYALGCTFRPTWMDVPPMIYSGNSLIMEPGMVFFVHIMIPDTRTGIAAGIGQTFCIRENGAPEVFSDISSDLYIR
ncbi:aminopeptidase P family protein [Pseudohalocynthiibacter aestuariivivens]|nr:Xaa-Pro peptidase family protein [Pseudohalocynthiibacter aestuariivivens]QIE45307.1 aminopeptidase P family protein [Pseudohalocynthiibacter aestuariivivens]